MSIPSAANPSLRCTQWHAACLTEAWHSFGFGRLSMASLKYPTSSTVMAEPAPIDLDWSKTALVIIDMQRDFMEPGGFGETHRNDLSQRARAVDPIASMLSVARDAGILVIPAREGHLPDLSDAPPAKIERGAPS